MDLGIKMGEMYPTAVDAKKKHYPSVTLPYKLIDKDCEVGEEVTLVLKGKINRIERSDYAENFSVELTDGEVKES